MQTSTTISRLHRKEYNTANSLPHLLNWSIPLDNKLNCISFPPPLTAEMRHIWKPCSQATVMICPALTSQHLFFAVRFVCWIPHCRRTMLAEKLRCCDLGLNITCNFDQDQWGESCKKQQSGAIRHSDGWRWWIKIEDELVSELHNVLILCHWWIGKFLEISSYRG